MTLLSKRSSPKPSNSTWRAITADETLRWSMGDVPDPESLSPRTTRVAGRPVREIRESPRAPTGITIIGASAVAGSVSAAIREHGSPLGLLEVPPEVFDTLRIEAGTPVFGRDVDEDNLPQEVGRDAVAISFVKGCYLGQETVARIDALGHVNRASGACGSKQTHRRRRPAPRSRPTGSAWGRSRPRRSRQAGVPPWHSLMSEPHTPAPGARCGSCSVRKTCLRSSSTSRCVLRPPLDGLAFFQPVVS